MAIVQEIRNETKDMTGLVFTDLAHMPYVSQPDSIDGITEEWFQEQKLYIEKQIDGYEHFYSPSFERELQIGKLRKLIERLRKFTTGVVASRAVHETASTPVEPEHDPIREEYARQQRYEKKVDELLSKKKQDEEIAKNRSIYH